MPSPTSSIFGGGRGGIKTESLAGHGNVEGQGPGLVPGFLKGAWVGRAHLWMAQMGLSIPTRSLGAGSYSRTPGLPAYSPHVLSLTDTSLPCLQPRGDWGSVVHISTSSSHVFPVTPCCLWPAPAAQATQGHLDRLLVVPLHGNLSSRCWDSQMRRYSRLRDNGPWPP